MQIERKKPENLSEAIEFLKKDNEVYLDKIKAMTEDEFMGQSHHFIGMGIRNGWYLWWMPDWEEPKEKPPIVQFFNDLDIYHADDMSGIILTTFYRQMVGNLDIDLEGQIKRYKDHWKEYGFKDGVFIPG